MKKRYVVYVVITIILMASIYFLVVSNINNDETIYINMHDDVESVTNEENNFKGNVTEELAVENLISYLYEQNQTSKGFEVHLEDKEQEEDKHIMQVFSVVGEDESQSKENLGLYSVSKSTGKISELN
ncbi:hypothetical protein [Alkalibacillus almallahensis]|uniref:hypothetical protein n=1 Tax=Alkalibacillus almallahensis TaxID=1379154 RepID=UPI00141FBA6E|nr:hypothetical protein [Alkalibacillus almallahensis]NIK12970.1 preprotein translocase subunit SecF [Alkalibacillus almallahensis]